MTSDQLITLKEERVSVIQGKPFYDKSLPKALAQAQHYAGKKGYVASMPHLMLNFPHQEWYTANSEDLVGIDADGLFGEKGQAVVVTYHGGGIFAGHPQRIQKAYDEKLTPQYAGKITTPEFAAALRGEVLPRGKAPVYKFEEFLEESVSATFLEDYPVYGVVRSFENAKSQPSGSGQKIADLVNHTQVIVYAGGKQRAVEAMERAAKVYQDGKLGVWHPFNVESFDVTQAQGRLPFLVINPDYGLSGYISLNYGGRFVGVVAAEPHRVRKRVARAEKNGAPSLDTLVRSVLAESKELIAPRLNADFERRVRASLRKSYR